MLLRKNYLKKTLKINTLWILFLMILLKQLRCIEIWVSLVYNQMMGSSKTKDYIQGYRDACIDILEEAEKIGDTYIIVVLKEWLGIDN